MSNYKKGIKMPQKKQISQAQASKAARTLANDNSSAKAKSQAGSEMQRHKAQKHNK